ncbi:MAG: hypothetical protein E6G92_01630 [Alphaproteobacteria bacterium]|nr:MAG: hypothetical protein E6G92_01630 [Alphaproteobacteria bacterium]
MSAAAEALLRALCPQATAGRATSRPWASADMWGERHRFELTLSEQAADSLLDGLGERQFALNDHIVADIALVARERTSGEVRVVIDALTIAPD